MISGQNHDLGHKMIHEEHVYSLRRKKIPCPHISLEGDFGAAPGSKIKGVYPDTWDFRNSGLKSQHQNRTPPLHHTSNQNVGGYKRSIEERAK
jgi:hypothetical protein